MRRCLSFIGALALMAGSFASVAEAGLIFYNQSNPLVTTPAGALGSYGGFNVTLTDTALTTDETGFHAGGPSAETYNPIKIQSVVLRRGSGSGGTAGAFLRISTTFGGAAVATSTNSIDMQGSAGEANVTFNFSGESLNPATNYFFTFRNAGGTAITGRIRVSNLAADTFTSGNLRTTAGAVQDAAFDAVFVVNAIPEPSSLLMLGMVGLGAVVRRRRA